jgi:hypothetical protein
MREKIQLSQETADLLRKSGRGTWIKERDNEVDAKGKGILKTFWLLPRGSKAPSVLSSASMSTSLEADSSFADDETPNTMPAALRNALPMKHKIKKSKRKELSDKSKRLVQWNVALLIKLLEKVAGGRNGQEVQDPKRLLEVEQQLVEKHSILEEVQEVIDVSKAASSDSPGGFKRVSSVKKSNAPEVPVEVPKEVVAQLTQFISKIAWLHPSNAFHNFEVRIVHPISLATSVYIAATLTRMFILPHCLSFLLFCCSMLVT